MQQPTNIRLVTAGLLGATSVLFALYGSSPSFTTKKVMTTQRAFTVANQYQLVHTIAILILAVAVPNLKDLPDKRVACELCMAHYMFVAGTVIMTVPRYLQCTVMDEQRWLGKVAAAGGAVLAAGWVAVISAAARMAKA